MNEYNDAIQRLEMPERPPGRTISRWTFPIPRKNTPWNYNYIFSNTGNMNIPKYSIPQTLIIINNNKDRVDSHTTELNNLITSLQKELETAEEELDTAKTAYETAKTRLQELREEYSNAESTYNDVMNDATKTDAEKQTAVNDYNTALNAYNTYHNDTYTSALQDYLHIKSEVAKLNNRITNYQTELSELSSYVGKSVFDFYLDEQFVMTQGSRKSIAIRAIDISPVEYECAGDETISDDVQYVCSSINPWSKNNIIGNRYETFHNIPRMFPWNGQQHISIWFLNSYGKHIEIPCIKGVIELELIIDNENTFGYE